MVISVRTLAAGALVVGATLLPGSAVGAPTHAGALDATFGKAGKAYADFGRHNPDETAHDVVVQDNGRTVAVGTVLTDISSQWDITHWAVARWRPDGRPDTSFSSNGRAVTEIGRADGADSARAVDLHDHGKILVGGTSDGILALVDYTPRGEPNRAWGDDGIVTTEVPAGYATVLDVRVLGNGTVLAAGTAGDRLVVAHYAPDGGLEQVVTSAQPFGGTVNAVEVQRDGSLLATGASDDAGMRSVRTVRVDPAGVLDPTFGVGGAVTTEIPDSDASRGNSVLVQPDGKVLVGGSSYGPGDYSYYLVLRYLPDGTLDTSFGGGGHGYTDDLFDYYSEVSDLALQPDGRIATTGWAAGEDPRRVVVARYTAAGVLDRSFNGKGYRTIAFPVGSSKVPPSWAEGTAVAVSAGRLTVVGDVNFVSGVDNARFLAVRLRR